VTGVDLLGALFLKPVLVIGSAAAITACLRRHAAAARHAVWAAAIILTAAIPALSITLPPLRIPGFQDVLASLPWLNRSAVTMSTAGERLETPAVGTAPGGDALGWDLVHIGPADWLPKSLFAIWILGALALGTRRVISEGRLRRIVRRARPVSNVGLEVLFAGIVRSSGIRQRVELRWSEEISTPAVAGLFRSVILLPTSVATWAEADVAFALEHELGHVARRDCLLNVVADVAMTVYWCNPAVRIAARRMQRESENACDDRVLRGGAEPKEYARLLLEVARGARGSDALPGVAMARTTELESRILAVLDAGVRRVPPSRWLSVVLTCFGITLALPIASVTLGTAPFAIADPVAPEPDLLADSLSKPGSERVGLVPETYRLSPGAVEALEGPDSTLASSLVAALGHTPIDEGDLVRERAAWALSQARNGRLVEPLLGALHASDWRIRAYAAWALATARDPRAVASLVPLLSHPIWRLRAMAAYALRELGDRRAEEGMSAALHDPAWQVRLEAVKYFSVLGGPTLAGRLRARLDDRHIAVRFAAEQALAPL
jgi:beta-lactamase regulating signal transducer with metallopeptidase domain